MLPSKKSLSLVGLSLILIVLATSAQASDTPSKANRKFVENPSLDTSKRYDDGARWAFVTDAQSKNVAVIDTFNNTHVDTLEFQVVPQELRVSDITDIIVYTDYKSAKLYVYDVVRHAEWDMELDFVPTDISFHENAALMAVAGKGKIQFVEPYTQKTHAVIEGIEGEFSMNFDAGGYNLYITESASGKTHVYRFHDQARKTIQMGSGGAVTDITLSPDARIALVADHEKNQVHIKDLMMSEKLNPVQLSAKGHRPYVSSDSNYIVLASHDGKGKVLDAWMAEPVRDFTFKGKPHSIRTGWLETIGLLESDQELTVFALTEPDQPKYFPLSNPLNEVVVVSDSKTLFATQQNSSELMVFDIRSGKLSPRIETGLKAPTHIAMGLTNTTCH